MAANSEQKWDAIYSNKGGGLATAAQVLRSHNRWLPDSGEALDFACGRGGNALLLAQQGLRVHAWDISSVALQQLQTQVVDTQLSVQTRQLDLRECPLLEARFDVICCSYYLHRERLTELSAALRPGGLLFYETYNQCKSTTKKPRNPDFLLAQGELLEAFSGLQVLYYQELWGVTGVDGDSGVSRLVARRATDAR